MKQEFASYGVVYMSYIGMIDGETLMKFNNSLHGFTPTSETREERCYPVMGEGSDPVDLDELQKKLSSEESESP